MKVLLLVLLVFAGCATNQPWEGRDSINEGCTKGPAPKD